MTKPKIATWGFFFLFLVILFFVFRTLFLNLGYNLTSWLDVPYVIWVMGQNADKIQHLDFSRIFETNAFYPNKLTLLYSDVFITQSIIYYLFSLFSKNIVLVFNLTLIATLILNYWSLFIFWSLFTKNKLLSFLAVLLFFFSPFFFYQFGHFQMMSYWPLFFSLYFLLRQKEEFNARDSIICGIFLSLQFLASVYLAIFLIFLLGPCLLLDLLFDLKSLSAVIKKSAVIFGIFILICGFFIKGYLDMKKIYNFQRNPAEYTTYSAHITDYFFTTGKDTVFNRIPIIQKWNSFNNHGWGERAGFPGFLLLTLSIVGILGIAFSRDKTPIRITANFKKKDIFFFTIMVMGFVFSLGIRLGFNGTVSSIPNIYEYLIRFIPFLDSIRGTARWSFLFYLGLTWFSMKGLQKILGGIERKNIKAAVAVLICAIFAIESLPTKVSSHSEEYYVGYSKVESLCQKKKHLLLELPVSHLDHPDGIISGLNYISKVEMASTLHDCYIFNGYSGFEPPNLINFRSEISSILDNGNVNSFIHLLKKEEIEIIKINDRRWDNHVTKLVERKDLEKIGENLFLVR